MAYIQDRDLFDFLEHTADAAFAFEHDEFLRPDTSIEALSKLSPEEREAVGFARATGTVVEFYLALASAIVTLGRLIRQAWSCYRWQTRPRRRP